MDTGVKNLAWLLKLKVPIISSTRRLVDIVKEGFTGFHMEAFSAECEAIDPADVEKLATTVKRAIQAYGTLALKEIIQNCMAQDFSWKGPAKQWEKVLFNLEVAGNEPGIDGERIAPLTKENVPSLITDVATHTYSGRKGTHAVYVRAGSHP
ncbi:hypothetical protein VNO77_19211 [Canavalia gladiata]|uniref:Uncharacterized protein n=1 Tax=Canavalia gladiata TaxID=3824 RepID=A0AAN9LM87_CANGL